MCELFDNHFLILPCVFLYMYFLKLAFFPFPETNCWSQILSYSTLVFHVLVSYLHFTAIVPRDIGTLISLGIFEFKRHIAEERIPIFLCITKI